MGPSPSTAPHGTGADAYTNSPTTVPPLSTATPSLGTDAMHAPQATDLDRSAEEALQGLLLLDRAFIGLIAQGPIIRSPPDKVSTEFADRIHGPALKSAAAGAVTDAVFLDLVVAPSYVFNSTCDLAAMSTKQRKTTLLKRINMWSTINNPASRCLDVIYVFLHQRWTRAVTTVSAPPNAPTDGAGLSASCQRDIGNYVRAGKISRAVSRLEGAKCLPSAAAAESLQDLFPRRAPDSKWPLDRSSEEGKQLIAAAPALTDEDIDRAISRLNWTDAPGANCLPMSTIIAAYRLSDYYRGMLRLFLKKAVAGGVSLSNLLLSSVRLVALEKTSNSALANSLPRPVGIPSCIIWVSGSAFLYALRAKVVQILMTTGQLGIAVSGGVQTAIHAIRAAVARGKASLLHRGLALLDYKNAFNHANRSAAMRVVMRLVPEFVAYINSLYGDLLNGYLYGYSALSIEEGSIQGETFGSILFALLNHQLNLDFLASTGHSDVVSADIMNVSIIDDVSFEAPIQTVVDYVVYVISNSLSYGMELSASKTLILANNAESATAFSHLLAGRGCAGTIQSDNIRSLDSISGFTSLGAGFSCLDADRRQLRQSQTLWSQGHQGFRKIGAAGGWSSAFRLLHAALAFPKEVFYAATHAPGLLPTALHNHHDLVLSALQDRLPVGLKLNSAASLIARLPFHRGGLALRSAHELRDCIYLASSSAASLNFSTLPMFAPLHWSRNAAGDIVAGSLQNINALVASLDRQLVPSDANTKAQAAQLSNWDGGPIQSEATHQGF
jgi:hypothetical protein